MPTSSRQRSTTSTGAATSTPSASSTSAEPERDDCARLPCLATRTPAAATTSAAMVDTLMVPRPSPPVPQVSTTTPAGTRSLCARARIARRGAHHLVDGLALHAQGDEQRADLRRRGLAVHDAPDRRGHLVGASRSCRAQARAMAAARSISVSSRKLRNRRLPSTVRIDSGWNCTPHTGSVVCASAMISPSAVRAVTVSDGGSDAGSTTSE